MRWPRKLSRAECPIRIGNWKAKRRAAAVKSALVTRYQIDAGGAGVARPASSRRIALILRRTPGQGARVPCNVTGRAASFAAIEAAP